MWETQFQSDVKCTKTEKKNINGNTIGKSLYKDNLLNLINIYYTRKLRDVGDEYVVIPFTSFVTF